MGIEDFKHWHWMVIGVLTGALAGFMWSVPGNERDPVLRSPMTVEEFANRLPALREIVVHPARDGQNFVTAEYGRGQNVCVFVPVSRDVVGMLRATPSVAWKYLWWQEWWVGPAVGMAAGAVLIGVVWPVLLGLMLGAGLGRREPDEPAYDLSRFKPEPVAAKLQPTAKDMRYVEELDQQLEANLSAGATVLPGTAPEEVSVTVAKLTSAPLEPLQPAMPEEAKEYKGEFYPVAKKPHHGFSLVEILVVIGIIAILIGLLLPTIRRARQSSNAVLCSSNMRQIFIGLQSYLVDNQGMTFWRGRDIDTDGMDWYVYGGREQGNTSQLQAGIFNTVVPRPLNKYLGNKIEVFRCPCDDMAPWSHDEPAASEFEWVGNSYNFNANGHPQRAAPRQDGGLDGVRFSSIRDSSHTIVFYEACAVYGGDWHYHYKINVAFADGHVEFMPLPAENQTPYIWDAPGTRDQ